MRFIHTADLHLGAAMTGAPYRAMVRHRELRALQNIIEYAEAQGIQYVVVAGDLFDSVEPPLATLRAVQKMLSQTNLRFFIAAGNHDILRDGKYMDGAFSENVHIFPAHTERVRVEEGSFIGASLSLGQPHPFGNIDLGEGINVGVFHGNIGDSDKAYRIEASAVEHSGLDFLALGHIHKREKPYICGKTQVANCGATVCHGFDEKEVGAVYDVTLTEQGAEIREVPLGRDCTVRFGEREVVLQADMDQAAVLGALVTSAGEMNAAYDVFRLRVCGESACFIPPLLEDMPSLVEIINETTLPIDLTELAKSQTLQGYFVSAMKQRLSACTDDQRAVVETALRLGLEAFE